MRCCLEVLGHKKSIYIVYASGAGLKPWGEKDKEKANMDELINTKKKKVQYYKLFGKICISILYPIDTGRKNRKKIIRENKNE